jgi:DNA-binding MarR family transcriptional regulator
MSTDVEKIMKSFPEIFRLLHQRSYQKFGNVHLYPGQHKLLALIRMNEGITQKELAEKNFVKPATITGMLSKLEANRYVYRVPDETDKRIMRVYLTKEGQQLAEHAEKFIKYLSGKLFEGFTEEELQIYLKLTEKIRDNLQK